MNGETREIRPSEGDLARLAELLAFEEEQYRRLLRLAWRQNSYMKRQDVDRLAVNSREWTKYLAVANTARAAREKFLERVGARLGLKIPAGNVSAFVEGNNGSRSREIRTLLARIKSVAMKLARQNELNRVLAEFCLELAHEENEIFKRCVLEDPTGCYGGDAQRADRGPGGVLVRQA